MKPRRDIDLYDPSADDPIPVLPWQTVRAAALTICREARDLDDARLLMDALGLRDGDHLSTLRTVRPLASTSVQFRGSGKP